jgi:CelD/BcsL family acetyltransferase involved in cellulose biosynthesis
MKLVEIRDAAGFEALAGSWDALLRAGARATPFNSWEWASAWWQAYGAAGELRILAALDEGGTLRGVAPLREQVVRRCGIAARALRFVGDGSNDSDYLDVVLAPGWEARVMEAFRGHWEGEMRRGAVLLLNEIPEDSAALPPLREWGGEGRMLSSEAPVACLAAPLPATFEEYLRGLRPRFRTAVRSALRTLEGRGEARFVFPADAEEALALLPTLFDLHARRWAREAKPGVFGWESKREFYRRLTPLFSSRGWLRFSRLEWNGRVLACQYGFVMGGVYYQLQEGFEPDAAHLHAGAALRAWSIARLIEEGVRAYDFLAGSGSHKTDWGAQIGRAHV